jgi:hypothetical protein
LWPKQKCKFPEEKSGNENLWGPETLRKIFERKIFEVRAEGKSWVHLKWGQNEEKK